MLHKMSKPQQNWQHQQDVERRRMNRTKLRRRITHKLKHSFSGDSVNEAWLQWVDSNLRVIPKSFRRKGVAIGIWLTTIYDEVCEHCESIGMDEDLLLENLQTYNKFLASWTAFCEEEDPEILRRKTRDISFRTKGYSKRKVCVHCYCFLCKCASKLHSLKVEETSSRKGAFEG